MNQAVRQVVAQARRRLGWRSWVQDLAVLLTINLTAVALCRLACQFVGCSFSILTLIAFAVAAALLAAFVRVWGRCDDRQAALEIDRRFGLDERVVSALESTANGSTPAGRALADDATHAVAGLDIASQFPIVAGTPWWWPAAPAGLVLVLAMVLPPPQTAATPTIAPVTTPPEVQFAKVLKTELAERERAARLAGLEAAAQLLAQSQREAVRLVELPQEVHEALVQLNGLAEPLAERRDDLAAGQQTLEQLAKLRDKSEGLTSKLRKLLREQDIPAAAEELRRLSREWAQDQIDSEGQEDLARPWEDLSREISDLAADQRRQAQNSSDDRAGQQATDSLDAATHASHTDEQVTGRLERLAVALDAAGDALGRGEGSQAAEEGLESATMLEELNQEHVEGVMLSGALDEIAAAKHSLVCEGCRGAGCPACRLGSRSTGGRHGPPGSRTGLRQADQPHPTMPARFDTRLPSQLGPGPAQVRATPGGPNARGQVREAIASEWTISEESAADASAGAALEAKYREHARQYFDAMRSADR